MLKHFVVILPGLSKIFAKTSESQLKSSSFELIVVGTVYLEINRITNYCAKMPE